LIVAASPWLKGVMALLTIMIFLTITNTCILTIVMLNMKIRAS
jgi:hypothetical protein